MSLAKTAFIVGIAVATAVSLPGAAATVPNQVAYTVSGGGPGGAITLSNIGNLVLTDTVGGAQWTCAYLGAPGTAQLGGHGFAPASPPSTPPLDSAFTTTLSSSSLTGCSNPTLGAATITPSGTWSFGVVSKTGNLATGYLDFVQAHLASPACSFDFKGYIEGSYDSSSGRLTTSAGARLTISGVVGSACALARVANGHTGKLSGTVGIMAKIFF